MAKGELSWRRALDSLSGICARDWHVIIHGFVGPSGSMLLDLLARWRGCASISRCEGALRGLGCGRWCLCRRCLQLEAGFGLGELRLRLNKLRTRSEGAFLDVGQVAVGGRGLAGRHGILAKSRRLGAESRSVGCGLTAQLGEVEVGAGAVSHVHGLEEASLRVVSVEDDAVQQNAENLDYDFDDDADQGPVLQTADERVVDLVTEDLGSSVGHARPSPHVRVVGVVLGVLEQSRSDDP